jgi:RHS repeat-associated protein
MTLPNGVVANYAYDSASQLAGMTYSRASLPIGDLQYSYDNVGRRISIGGSLARTVLPQAISGNVYNTANQLTQAGGVSLAYDLNGNLTSDGLHTYSWNARNQLTAIDSGGTAAYAYDVFGRRITKNISGTASTTILYDGLNAVQEISGGLPTANLLTGGVDEVFARSDSSGTSYFLPDALGSTVALTDGSGTVQTQYNYGPFGNSAQSGASSTNSVAFAGRELDPAGLYYSRARYYSSTLQRFISQDPVGFIGGINLYGYAGNNPVNLIDPLGTNSKCGGSFMCGLDQDVQNLFNSVNNLLDRLADAYQNLPMLAGAGFAGGLGAEEGAVSRLAQDGGLMNSENVGGHLIEKHVGLSDADLASRLLDNPRMTAASTFANRAEAEAAIAGALDANAAELADWISAGANGRLELEGSFSGGSVLQRGASGTVPGNGLRVVLQGNGSGGYFILTGFPVP